ncbi:MAG: hypothetical protein KF901_00125 [Myxococcales bacterium]|nr:hypothetical protein [Myxococcales bacterium]
MGDKNPKQKQKQDAQKAGAKSAKAGAKTAPVAMEASAKGGGKSSKK